MTNYFSVTPQLKHFQFIVVGLEELPPDQTAALAERVCDCLYERGAMIDCITSLWIIASWGAIFNDDSPEARLAAVSDLLTTNASSVRIAHGQCLSIVGNIGSRQRFNYEALIPGLQDIREKLSQTKFGTAFEVPEKMQNKP